MRTLPIILMLLLTACGRIERERNAAAEAARSATLLEVEQALARATERSQAVAASANRILSPLPVMTPGEEDALRRFRNAAHVARARELGVRVTNGAALDSLVALGRLVPLADSSRHWIVRPGTAPAYVLPELSSLLEELGSRFQARLADLDLPPYRIEVTSALRHSERQEELRSTNGNAARGVSAHEFGATVDLSYAAFAPPLEVPGSVLTNVPGYLVPHVERFADLALESVSARKSRELGAIFSRVLREAQSEGVVLVTYERQQTVYHVTVGSRLVPSPSGRGSP